MIKVQHGWQHHNIDQLERLESTRVSPVSGGSPVRELIGSSNANRSPLGRPTSSHSASNMCSHDFSPNQPRRRNHSNPPRSLPFSAPASATLSGGTQWQDQRLKPIFDSYPSIPQAPSLAPPLDIHPRSTRTSTPSPQDSYDHRRSPAPAFSPASALPVAQALQSSNRPRAIPSTPPSAQSPPKRVSLGKLRTPSQQAAVEKDAVETLLFMSSPGNSQHYPSVPQRPPSDSVTSTPQRTGAASMDASAAHYIPTPRRSRQNDVFPGPDSRQRTIPPEAVSAHIPYSNSRRRRPLEEDDIDRMLDDMGDSDSDSQ